MYSSTSSKLKIFASFSSLVLVFAVTYFATRSTDPVKKIEKSFASETTSIGTTVQEEGLIKQISTANIQVEEFENAVSEDESLTSLQVGSSIEKKVLVLNFDPIVSNGMSLIASKGWYDTVMLQNKYIDYIKQFSHNTVNYRIVENKVIRDYPLKKDGFKFTYNQYNGCLTDSSPWYCIGTIDYARLVSDYNLCTKISSGQIDEVWLWGGPYFGYLEWANVGSKSLPYMDNVAVCDKRFTIMGFSYHADHVMMLHNFGHRTEYALTNIYGNFPYDTASINQSNPWSRFTIYDKVKPGKASCGNVHYSHNSAIEYEHTNQNLVPTKCDDWVNYPNMSGITVNANCSLWNCGQSGDFYEGWWLSRLPYKEGLTNNRHNNWWKYSVDYENAKKPVNYAEKTYAVENGANDSYVSCGTAKSGSANIIFGTDSACNTSSTAIFKFPKAQMLKGSYIKDAYVEFVSGGNYTNTMTLNINVTDGITNGSVSWNITEPWNAQQIYRSVDIGSIIQKIISNADWVSGKSLTVKISRVSGDGDRKALAFEGEAVSGARLIINVHPKIPSAPTLASPGNNFYSTVADPTFKWNASTNKPAFYNLQVDDNVDFSSPIVDYSDIEASGTSSQIYVDLPRSATSYWRVRASNSFGDWGGWSAVRSIIISPKEPGLMSPTHTSTVSSLKPTFTWSAASGASSYRIQISPYSDMREPVIDNSSVSTNSFTPGSNLVSKKTYYWRVQSKSSVGNSIWSDKWNFKTP